MLNFIMKVNDWYERKSIARQTVMQIIASVIIVTLTMLIGIIWTPIAGIIFYFSVWFVFSSLCFIVELQKLKKLTKKSLLASKEEDN